MKRILLLLISFVGIFNHDQLLAQCNTCPASALPDSTIRILVKLPFHEAPDSVWVAVYDSLLVFEGDIVLGKLADLQKTSTTGERGIFNDVAALWTNSTIPYVIGSGFSAAMIGQINFAIDYMNRSTNICMIPRTNQANYLTMIPTAPNATFCYSDRIGMGSGEQFLGLDDIGDGGGCWYGTIVHEILHAAGFWHEQSREDRDTYVDILWNNIIQDPGLLAQFDKHISDGQDIGNYDYLSIMHYGPLSFTANGQPTITRKNGATDLIGNRAYLSGTDIEAINILYDAKCGTCLDRKVKITPHSMTHNNIGHWEIDGALYFQDNTAFATNTNSRAEFDSGTFIDINPTASNSAPFEAAAGSVVEMGIDGCPGTVPTWYSLQCLNFPNYYIRHFNYVTRIDKIEDIYAGMPADANFKIVNAFDASCGDCVSFESKNFPNYFLVVDGGNGSQVRIVSNGSVSNFAQKATFRLHSGFASASGVSLESWFAPGNFINHSNYVIYINPYVNDRLYRERATFRLTTGL